MGPGHERVPVTGWRTNISGILAVVVASAAVALLGGLLALTMAVLYG